MEKTTERKLIATVTLSEEAKNPNNAYLRSNNTGKGFKGMFMKADYKKYKERWVEAAKAIKLKAPYEGNVAVISTWTFGTRRRKDLQNCGKLEYDALNDIIYLDDSQIMEITCNKAYSKNNPSVTIEVWSAPDTEELWPL